MSQHEVTSRPSPTSADAELGAAAYESLLRFSPHLVGLLSPDGDIRYLSPAAVDLLCGQAADSWDTDRGLDAVHPDDLAVVIRAFVDALEQPGVAIAFPHRTLHANGEVRHIIGTYRNLIDHPDVQGIALYCVDVTDHEHLALQLKSREAEQEQRIGLEAAMSAIARNFVDRPADEFGACIEDALAQLGEIAGVARAWVLGLDATAIDRGGTWEWCAPGVGPAHAEHGRSMETWGRLVNKRGGFVIADVKALELPEWEQTELDCDGVAAILAVPIMHQDELIGYVGLHSAVARIWDPLVQSMLERYASLHAVAWSRRRAEIWRGRADARLQGWLAASWDSLVVIDEEGRLAYATPRLAQVLGRPVEDLLGSDMLDVVHPDDKTRITEHVRDVVAGTVPHGKVVEMRAITATGAWIDVEIVSTSRLDDPDIEGLVFNVRDITERKAFAATLHDAQMRFEEVFEHAPIGMALAELSGQFFRVNPALCTMLGYSGPEMLGHTFTEFTHPDDLAANIELHDALTAGTRRSYLMEKRYRRSDGTYIWCSVNVGLVCSATGEPVYKIGQITDISEQKSNAAALEREARYDTLTGLATRKLFLDALERSLGASRRRKSTLAVLFIDLDHFKHVNDTLGHSAGDELLVVAAKRLESVLRPTDLACRFGGDEFVVLCPDLQALEDVAFVAERVRAIIEQPFRIRDTDLFVGASIGIAIADDGADSTALLSQADSAAYRAKARGRNRYEVFDEELRSTISRRLETEQALRRAIDERELILAYQPIVETATGRVRRFEALLRWDRPGHGIVMPGEFLDVAEDRDLIIPIGYQVLELACAQVRAWRNAAPDGTTPHVAVNVSARQFAHPDFAERVEAIVNDAHIDPSWISLELTETTLMDDMVATSSALRRLRDFGISFAIDDFGTGFSSLSYLRRMPVSVVKIDRSFVLELGETQAGTAIVASVIQLAHALGMRVVAEGVENAERVAALVTLGCDYIQGFYFAPSLTPAAALQYMHEDQRSRARPGL